MADPPREKGAVRKGKRPGPGGDGGGAWGYGGGGGRLEGAEEAISRIAQAGQDVAVVVQLLI